MLKVWKVVGGGRGERDSAITLKDGRCCCAIVFPSPHRRYPTSRRSLCLSSTTSSSYALFVSCYRGSKRPFLVSRQAFSLNFPDFS